MIDLVKFFQLHIFFLTVDLFSWKPLGLSTDILFSYTLQDPDELISLPITNTWIGSQKTTTSTATKMKKKSFITKTAFFPSKVDVKNTHVGCF